ncbi:cyclic pyranopterin monophosphate synthase MoaC [Jeotgalibacillus soli]|uniref:Cyclic pyranopterin monophosphate synthase n=1 Tax=Jeotgalibacillus soli TaxID=889306 RepID=A0A0C2VSJ6_9BACL|nr:cyclic pyranopterin monophosphate synthase MoaC [Jeotgalibacillus soli]KIL51897.1 molybdenum cofactor biosynthesis protein C [Jeotgalibacillus soli]
MSDFTHFNDQGRAKMVDITQKPETSRSAIAQSSILLNEEIYTKITNNEMKKGDVLAVAQVAGIMAAKQTSTLIPMCHPIPISGIDISFDWIKTEQSYKLSISSTVKTKGSTGVEMEALTAASVCALTVYDMCKAVDKGMIIGPTFLKEKKGGKNGDFSRQDEPV